MEKDKLKVKNLLLNTKVYLEQAFDQLEELKQMTNNMSPTSLAKSRIDNRHMKIKSMLNTFNKLVKL